MYLKNLATIASALALAACAVGTKWCPARNADRSRRTVHLAAKGPAIQPLAPVEANWWRLYNDPVLDGLIADALRCQHATCASPLPACARRGAALREVKVDRLPDVGASASARPRRRRRRSIKRQHQLRCRPRCCPASVDLFGRVEPQRRSCARRCRGCRCRRRSSSRRHRRGNRPRYARCRQCRQNGWRYAQRSWRCSTTR